MSCTVKCNQQCSKNFFDLALLRSESHMSSKATLDAIALRETSGNIRHLPVRRIKVYTFSLYIVISLLAVGFGA